MVLTVGRCPPPPRGVRRCRAYKASVSVTTRAGHGGGVILFEPPSPRRSYVYPSSTSITGSSNSSAVMGHTSCSASRSSCGSGDSTVESLETSVSSFDGGGRDGGDAGLSPEGVPLFLFLFRRDSNFDNMALFRADWDRVRELVHCASRLSILSNAFAVDELVYILHVKLFFADCRLSNASASSTTRMSFFRVSACCTSFVFTVSRTGSSASMWSTRSLHRVLFCLTRCFASPQLLMTAAIAMMVCDMPPNAQGRGRRLLDR